MSDTETLVTQTLVPDPTPAAQVLLVPTREAGEALRDAAPEGWTVVALPSPTGWQESGHVGVPTAGIGALTDAAEVVIVIPATSRPAFDALTGLGDYLAGLVEVRYAQVPGDSVTATALATPQARRGVWLDRLLDRATGRPGKRPTRSHAGVFPHPTVDERAAVIRADDDPEAEILLTAAARIVGGSRTWTDMGPDAGPDRAVVRHTLALRALTTHGVETATVPDVPDDKLAKPRTWLVALRGGREVTVASTASATMVGAQIEDAIRRTADASVADTDRITHTGWADLPAHTGWGFLTPTGQITSAGMDQDAVAVVSPAHRALALPDPAGHDLSEMQDAAQCALTTVMEVGSDPVRWMMTGLLWYGYAGLMGRGRGTGSAGYVYGAPGSGKSRLIRGLRQAFVTPGTDRPTVRFQDTEAVFTNAYRGADSLLIVADDFRHPRSGDRDAGWEKLQAMVRPGYEGSAGARAKSTKDGDGNWQQGDVDPSSPVVLIGAEGLPEGQLDDVSSTMERLCAVEVTRENAFASGTVRVWDARVADPRNPLHAAGFVQWVAGQIDAAGSLAAWRKPWLDQQAELQARMVTADPSITPRIAEVHSVPAIGVSVWLQYLTEIAVIPDAQRETMVEDVAAVMTKLAREAAARYATFVSPWRDAIERISEALGAGRVALSDADGHVPQVGFKPATRPEIALIPAECVRVLRSDPRWSDLTTAGFVKIMEPVARRAADGRSTISQRGPSGAPIRCVVVSTDVWGGTDGTVEE